MFNKIIEELKQKRNQHPVEEATDDLNNGKKIESGQLQELVESFREDWWDEFYDDFE